MSNKIAYRDKFKNELNSYYQYLLNRFNNGSNYLKTHTDDVKAMKVYNDIIRELSQLEILMDFYNIDKENK